MTRFIRVLQRETKPVSALVFDSDFQCERLQPILDSRVRSFRKAHVNWFVTRSITNLCRCQAKLSGVNGLTKAWKRRGCSYGGPSQLSDGPWNPELP